MNSRARTLWVPGLISLTGSMAWRLVLQRSATPNQTLLNHAGLSLVPYLVWLAPLPLLGAAGAYLSRRAGGKRSTRIAAALLPSIVMIPLWIGLATRMSHPSAGQFLGLFSGLLYWIVIPGAALLLGALPFLQGGSLGVNAS